MPRADETSSPPDNLNLRSYRDDATSVSFDDSENTAFISPSEASDEEYFRDVALRPFRKYLPSDATGRLQRGLRAVVDWTKGPDPPRIWHITPYFPEVQEAPVKLVRKYLPEKRQRFWLLVAFYILWLIFFSSVLHRSAFASDIPGYGSPTRITCVDRFWRKGNGCGLNGDFCRPFDNSTFTFRCPANCQRQEIYNSYAVGDQEINYRQLVIGGPTSNNNDDDNEDLSETHYRGDSFICGAAIHAGFINDASGGCGVLRLTGAQDNFPSSKHHGIKSIEFDSHFPLSYTFVPGTAEKCRDLRWPLFGVTLTFTILLSLFTTNPYVFFWSEFVLIFFHVALASDPPNLTDYYSIVSTALGRFLPAAFCGFVIYKYCTKRQMRGLTAQFEKTILWLGACWVGALNNYTFDKIPIQRLTPQDLKQPGAVPALVIIVLSIFFIALGQAWAIRVEGRMRQYLALYCIFILGLLALVAVPRMNVRIHHYILALLLVPGTAMQNRPSLLYQGLLVGLFINGIARWDFDSILQTPNELRGDGNLGTILPVILPPIINLNDGVSNLRPNITFEWDLPFPRHYDGMSVLVNDVERFKQYEDQVTRPRKNKEEGEMKSRGSFTWVTPIEPDGDHMDEYFRFAFLSGSGTADYTKAGVWREDGGWKHMRPGASRRDEWDGDMVERRGRGLGERRERREKEKRSRMEDVD